MRSPVNFMRSPVNFMRSPVNFIRSPVNLFRSLVTVICSPADLFRGPAAFICLPVFNMRSPVAAIHLLCNFYTLTSSSYTFPRKFYTLWSGIYVGSCGNYTGQCSIDKEDFGFAALIFREEWMDSCFGGICKGKPRSIVSFYFIPQRAPLLILELLWIAGVAYNESLPFLKERSNVKVPIVLTTIQTV